jgi:hypothetical protein
MPEPKKFAEATMIRRIVVTMNAQGSKEFTCYVNHNLQSLHQSPEVSFQANDLPIGAAIYVFAPKETDRLLPRTLLSR